MKHHRRTCASCRRQPAIGWGEIATEDGSRFYCHGDGADCYVLALMELGPDITDELIAALLSQRTFAGDDSPATVVAGTVEP